MKGSGLIKDFKFLVKNFGFIIALKIRVFPVIFSKITSRSFSYYYHGALLSFLKKKLNTILLQYKELDTVNKPLDTFLSKKDGAIWVCWWQGEEAMPDIVKICYNSIKMNAGDYKVILITKFNYREFIDLPDRIENLVKINVISITHLSDIIRVKLLRKFGGIWIDATYWVTEKLDFKGYSFFTLRQRPSNTCTSISQMMWSGNFLMAEPENFLMRFLDDAFMDYWKRFNGLIDYFLLDYILKIAYDEIPSVRKELDAVPYTGDDPLWLNYHFNEFFEEETFNNVMRINPYAKLSWKRNYVKTVDGRLTYYGHFRKMTEFLIQKK